MAGKEGLNTDSLPSDQGKPQANPPSGHQHEGFDKLESKGEPFDVAAKDPQSGQCPNCGQKVTRSWNKCHWRCISWNVDGCCYWNWNDWGWCWCIVSTVLTLPLCCLPSCYRGCPEPASDHFQFHRHDSP